MPKFEHEIVEENDAVIRLKLFNPEGTVEIGRATLHRDRIMNTIQINGYAVADLRTTLTTFETLGRKKWGSNWGKEDG